MEQSSSYLGAEGRGDSDKESDFSKFLQKKAFKR